MPDVVDFLAWPLRGGLGQWIGHALVGLPVCTAVGLPLAWGLRRGLPRRWIARLDEGAPTSPGLLRAPRAVLIGAASHVVTDLFTHKNFVLLWPFYVDDDAFPAFWTRPWASVNLFVYKEPYPIALHTVFWAVASILGIVLFVRCLRRPATSAAPGAPRG